MGAEPPPRGRAKLGLKEVPTALDFFFQVKSAITKRLEQVLGPGDFDFHVFQAVLGAQKSYGVFILWGAPCESRAAIRLRNVR